MDFRNHILFWTIVPLLVLSTGAAYYRFMVTHDYMVSYEGACDPYTKSCFVGCDDEECSSEYYYTKIYRHARSIEAFCGTDITDCEAANNCQPGEQSCSVNYCDIEADGDTCETLTKDDL